MGKTRAGGERSRRHEDRAESETWQGRVHAHHTRARRGLVPGLIHATAGPATTERCGREEGQRGEKDDIK